MAFLTYKFASCYRFKIPPPAWLDGSCHAAAWLKWVSGRARSHVHGVGIACCVCILLEKSYRSQKKIMVHLFGGKKLGKNYRTGQYYVTHCFRRLKLQPKCANLRTDAQNARAWRYLLQNPRHCAKNCTARSSAKWENAFSKARGALRLS